MAPKKATPACELPAVDLDLLVKTSLNEDWVEQHDWMSFDDDQFTDKYEEFLCLLAARTTRVNKHPLRRALKTYHDVPLDMADFFASKIVRAFSKLQRSSQRDYTTGERMSDCKGHVIDAFRKKRALSPQALAIADAPRPPPPQNNTSHLDAALSLWGSADGGYQEQLAKNIWLDASVDVEAVVPKAI